MLKIKFKVLGDEYWMLSVLNKNATVSDLIEVANKRKKRDDLVSACVGDIELGADTPLSIYQKKSFILYPLIEHDASPTSDYFIFSNLSFEKMTNGIPINVDESWGYDAFKKHVIDTIRPNINEEDLFTIDLKQFEARFYLNDNLYEYGIISENLPSNFVKKNIFVVFTPRDIQKNNKINKFNITIPEHQFLLSPLFPSTEIGLVQISLLLQYILLKGSKSKVLIDSIAAVTGYVPLILNLLKAYEESSITELELVTISTCFQVLIRYYVPHETFKNENVYDFVLKVISYFLMLDRIPNINISSLDQIKLINYPPPNNFTIIDNIFSVNNYFKPKTPCEFDLSEKRPSFVLLPPNLAVCVKSSENNLAYDVFIPYLDFPKRYTIEILDYQFRNNSISQLPSIYSLSDISQIVIFCISDSKSMKNNGKIESTFQIIDSIYSRMKGYQINSKVFVYFCNSKLMIPIDSNISNYLTKITLLYKEKKPKLFKSVLKCSIKLNDISNVCKKSKKRIILITDSDSVEEDEEIKSNVIDYVIDNDIYIDSIVFDKCRDAYVLSKSSGSVCFKADNFLDQDPASLFEFCECESFVDISFRSIDDNAEHNLLDDEFEDSMKNIDDINKQKKKDVYFTIKNQNIFEYDDSLTHKYLELGFGDDKICTAEKASLNADILFPRDDNRCTRICHELLLIYQSDDRNPSKLFISSNCHTKNSSRDDIKIFPFNEKIDIWRLFIYPSNLSQYSRKWWSLIVAFPPSYPFVPPEFRFLSIPYHLNVSVDGRVCMNTSKYDANTMVIDYIDDLMNLLENPDVNSAIHIDCLENFLHNRKEYNRLVAESIKCSKDNYNEWIHGQLDD